MTAETIKLSNAEILTGTPKQVSRQLERVSAEQVIAVPLEHFTIEGIHMVVQAVRSLAPLANSIDVQRQERILELLVEELIPVVPPPEHLLVMARMAAEARKAVLESGDWLTAAEVAKVAEFSTTNPSAQPNKWKKEGLIFAVRHRGNDYYPGYALDPQAGYRPFKTLAGILKVFGDRKDDWGLAYWFASVNSFLGGKRPQDLLAKHPERIIAAARDELEATAHG